MSNTTERELWKASTGLRLVEPAIVAGSPVLAFELPGQYHALTEQQAEELERALRMARLMRGARS